jgi:hypothetical protein
LEKRPAWLCWSFKSTSYLEAMHASYKRACTHTQTSMCVCIYSFFSCTLVHMYVYIIYIYMIYVLSMHMEWIRLKLILKKTTPHLGSVHRVSGS